VARSHFPAFFASVGQATRTAAQEAAKQVPYWIPLAVLLVPAALMAIGSWLWPEVVWEDFVKKYYWDPIKNDEGYNVVNTASWAVLLGALMFVWYRILTDLNEPMDFGLALAATPYMAAGSIVRVLEDTRMFGEPLRYAFITPQIYVIITVIATLFFVYGLHLRTASRVLGVRTANMELAAAMGLLWVGYALLYVAAWEDIGFYANPIILFASLLVAWAWAARYASYKGETSPRVVLGAFGVAFLLFTSWYVVLWLTGEPWTQGPNETHAWVIAGMVVFPLIIVVAQYFIARRIAVTRPAAIVFAAPLNLLLVFAQMSDATMTSLGIDVYGYEEKHVVPRTLIALADGWGIAWPATAVMMTFKMLISLGVIWAIDLYAKEDAVKYPNLTGVAKLAIIIVGLSPGVRDAVRLAMGV